MKQPKAKMRAQKVEEASGALDNITKVSLLDRFESPESSSIAGAQYDQDSKTLRVQFKHGKAYEYEVLPSIWEGFLQADSKGSYFQSQIRPFYQGRPV